MKKNIKKKDLKIFAFIWSGIFIAIGILQEVNLFYYIASVFIIIGVFKPSLFSGFYKVWTKIGEFIG